MRLLRTAGPQPDPTLTSPADGIGLRKPFVLLARLLSEPRGLTREQLADILWPDMAPLRARASLRRALHVLRLVCGEQAFTRHREAVTMALPLITDWYRLQQVAERRDDAATVASYARPVLAPCATCSRSTPTRPAKVGDS